MVVTNESTLKELVDETGLIKSELISCRDNLKNNLSAKGVDVSGLNKIGELITKISKIETVNLKLVPTLLSYDSNHRLLESRDINTLSTVKSAEMPNRYFYHIGGDFNGAKAEVYMFYSDEYNQLLYSIDERTLNNKVIGNMNKELGSIGGVYNGGKLRLLATYSKEIREIDPKTFTIISSYAQDTPFNRIGGGFDFNTGKCRIFAVKGGYQSEGWSYVYELDINTLSIIRSKNIERSYMKGIDCVYDNIKNKLRLYCTHDIYNGSSDKILELDIDNFSILKEANTTRYYTESLCGCLSSSIMYKDYEFICK